MEGKFGMEGIPESENFTERIGTEAGSRWSDVLYKGKRHLILIQNIHVKSGVHLTNGNFVRIPHGAV